MHIASAYACEQFGSHIGLVDAFSRRVADPLKWEPGRSH